MTHKDNLVGINEAEKLLGVSKKTLRKWDNDGTLTAIRVGTRGDRKYKRDNLERFIDSSTKLKEIQISTFKSFIKNNSFWTEQAPGLPITTEMGTIEMSKINQYFKPGVSHCIFSFNKDYLKQALSIEESIACCKTQFNILKTSPNKIHQFVKTCEDGFIHMQKEITKIDFMELENLSQKKILKRFNEFQKEIAHFWSYSLAIEPYSPFLDEIYYPAFEKLVGNAKKANDAFIILTHPERVSFVAEERKSTLEIILKYLRSKKEKKILKESKNEDYLADIKFRLPNLFKVLQQHQQDFYWIQNSYGEHTILTITDFLEFIRQSTEELSLQQLQDELDHLNNSESLNEKRKIIIKELNLSNQIINELAYLRKIVWIKDERKKTVLMMLHQLFRFIKEFSRRARVEWKLIAYAKIDEIPKILEKSFEIELLHKRKSQCMLVSQNGNKFSLFFGNEAKLYEEKIFHTSSVTEHAEICGNTASMGGKENITGIVSVILDPKQELAKGNILVTSMTRPEFMPLMKKASAIVTDEGGITCHAAIVSRELNIPCIIGTKHATEVLKSGDSVELRLNHGTVKILKKN